MVQCCALKYKKVFCAVVLTAVSLWGVLGSEKPACAAGFYIQEQSVSGLGASFAGVAAMPRDASTIYYNPAGMSALEGGHVNIGGNLIYGMTDMDDTGSTHALVALGNDDGGNPIGTAPVPNFYLSEQITEDVWLGVGLSFPFGLGSKYNSGWFGRFDSLKSELTTTDIQPSFAYRVNERFAVGGGLNIQLVNAKLTSAIADAPAGEGVSTLEGRDDGTFGYTLGFLYEPMDGTTIGLNYKSAMHHKLEGRIKVVGTAGSDFDVSASADLNLPDIASIGVSHALNDQWTLLGQVNWFGWNNFQTIRAFDDTGTERSDIVQNYQTTWAFALGAEYRWNDKWALRAGYQFDETPTTDQYRTTRTPDGDRNWLSAGATYSWRDNVSVDFAATYIDVASEKIDLSRNSGLASVQADVDASVAIVGLALNYKF